MITETAQVKHKAITVDRISCAEQVKLWKAQKTGTDSEIQCSLFQELRSSGRQR